MEQEARRGPLASGALRNLPNALTGLRVLAVPVLVWLFLEGRMEAALWVFVAAQVTDALDGVLARALRAFTRFGAIFDPVADKLLGLTALALLTFTQRLPVWLLAAALFRDVCIASAAYILARTGRTVPTRPTRFGKYATFFLAATVLVALIHAAHPETPLSRPAVFALAVVALQMLAVSWAQYLWWWIRLMREPAAGPA